MNKLRLFRLGYLADIFLSMKQACHFKENIWYYLLPMVKLDLSSKNSKFWKLLAAIISLMLPQLKDFSDNIGGDLTNFFKCHKMKRINI